MRRRDQRRQDRGELASVVWTCIVALVAVTGGAVSTAEATEPVVVTVTASRSTSDPGLPSCVPAHAGATLGFPGDSFTLWRTWSPDRSVSVESFQVVGPASYSAALPGSWPTVWVAPNASPGNLSEYAATLRVQDPWAGVAVSGSAYLQICTPHSRVVSTHLRASGGGWQTCNPCLALAGDTVRVSAAASDGHPVWSTANPAWTIDLAPPGGSWSPVLSGWVRD